MYRYFKKIVGARSGDYIYFWKSKGLSEELLNILLHLIPLLLQE